MCEVTLQQPERIHAPNGGLRTSEAREACRKCGESNAAQKMHVPGTFLLMKGQQSRFQRGAGQRSLVCGRQIASFRMWCFKIFQAGRLGNTYGSLKPGDGFFYVEIS